MEGRLQYTGGRGMALKVRGSEQQARKGEWLESRRQRADLVVGVHDRDEDCLWLARGGHVACCDPTFTVARDVRDVEAPGALQG